MALRAILSLFLVYHLLTVVVLPNPTSILARQIGPFITPYANTLGLNTPWQFFSPDPSPHVYFEYEVIPEDWQTDSPIEIHRWPPLPGNGMWFDNLRRLVYHSRFVTVTPERIQNFFVPFLCQRHAGASGISLRTLYEEIPSMEKAQVRGQTFARMAENREYAAQQFPCPEGVSE